MWAVTYIEHGMVKVDLFSGQKHDRAKKHVEALVESGYTNVGLIWTSMIEDFT